MDLDLLRSTLEELGQPRFRFDQVWKWTAEGAQGYHQMTNLPAKLRDELTERVPFSTLTEVHRAEASDGTVKLLLNTHDGRPIETVLMRYKDGRRSICVSKYACSSGWRATDSIVLPTAIPTPMAGPMAARP